jgi:N6-adenosine-specific RNA methylase IME4
MQATVEHASNDCFVGLTARRCKTRNKCSTVKTLATRSITSKMLHQMYGIVMQACAEMTPVLGFVARISRLGVEKVCLLLLQNAAC